MTCRSGGCKPEAILTPLDLTVRDLFPEPISPKYPAKKAEPKAAKMIAHEPVLTLARFADTKRLAIDFLRAAGLHDHSRGVIFPYGDGLRRRLRKSVSGNGRFEWLNGTGTIGAYTASVLPPERQPRDGSAVFIVEGESDALTLWHAGLPAVGLPGSTQAAKLNAGHVAGFASVAIWQEPGEGGRTFADGVARRLSALGYAGPVKVIKDATDKDASALWDNLNADKAAFVEAVGKLIEIAKPHQAEQDTPIPAVGGLLTRNLGDVKMKPVHWLVPNFIPRGMLTLIAGHGGAGKSSLLAHFMACATRGNCAFGLEYPKPCSADVLVYNCEDAPSEVMVPRLRAAGAKVERVRLLTGATGPDGKPTAFSLLNVDQLEA